MHSTPKSMNLPDYGMYIRSMSVDMEHDGSCSMELSVMMYERAGYHETVTENFDNFTSDMAYLRKIQNSDNIAVKEHWEQLLVLLKLTEKEDGNR